MTWRLPAEWEPQSSVWMVWPRDETTWPGGRIEGARRAYAEAVQAVARHQRVDLVVHPDLDPPTLAGDVRLHRTEHVDSWIRDYGALTVMDDRGGRRCLKFHFDAWGQKYETLMADDDTATRLPWPRGLEPIDVVLEGGAVETDGQGTFLATESVAAARGQTMEAHEAILREHLGAKEVIWLREGVSGDDTDGHIDTITRFVAPRTVATTVTPDMDHADHRALLVNRERLHVATDALGRSLHVLDLPLPDPVRTSDGDPLPASHANFLITNEVVLVPTYGGVSDTVALDTLQACFPSRRVKGIDHRDLIWGFGGIHCLSMQVPSGHHTGDNGEPGERV